LSVSFSIIIVPLPLQEEDDGGRGLLHFQWQLEAVDFERLRESDEGWNGRWGERLRKDTRLEAEVRHRFAAFHSPRPWTVAVMRAPWHNDDPALALEIRGDQCLDDAEINDIGGICNTVVGRVQLTDTTSGQDLWRKDSRDDCACCDGNLLTPYADCSAFVCM
jgi:hypothetical protein